MGAGVIKAAGVGPRLVSAAWRASAKPPALEQKTAAIGKHMPWEGLAAVLWGSGDCRDAGIRS